MAYNYNFADENWGMPEDETFDSSASAGDFLASPAPVKRTTVTQVDPEIGNLVNDVIANRIGRDEAKWIANQLGAESFEAFCGMLQYEETQVNIPVAPAVEAEPTKEQIKMEKSRLTTRKNALTLWADGYELQRTARYMVFDVVKIADGTVYTVDVAAQTCDCPLFGFIGECKHSIATIKHVMDAIELLTPKGDLAVFVAERSEPVAPSGGYSCVVTEKPVPSFKSSTGRVLHPGAVVNSPHGFGSRAAFEKARSADFD